MKSLLEAILYCHEPHRSKLLRLYKNRDKQQLEIDDLISIHVPSDQNETKAQASSGSGQ